MKKTTKKKLEKRKEEKLTKVISFRVSESVYQKFQNTINANKSEKSITLRVALNMVLTN